MFTISGFSIASYDSNIFRIPGSSETPATIVEGQRGDLSQLLGLSLNLNKYYGLQQFQAEASYNHTWYQNFDYLNTSVANFNLGWKWHLTPRVGGSLTGSRKEVPADFDYYSDFNRRNNYVQQDYRFRLEANPFGGWYGLAGTGTSSVSNTVSTGEQPKSQLYYFDGGVAYLTRSGTRLQATGKHAQGKYSTSNTATFAAKRDFSEDTYELQLISRPDDLLTYRVTGGYVSRSHEDLKERDFSGWTGEGLVSWYPTEKLTFSLRGKRSVYPFQDSYFTFYKREDLTFTPQWEFSDKLLFSATAGLTRNKFGGESLAMLDGERTDKLGLYSVDAIWTPYLFLSIKASAGSRSRSSDFEFQNLDYSSSTVSLSITLVY